VGSHHVGAWRNLCNGRAGLRMRLQRAHVFFRPRLDDAACRLRLHSPGGLRALNSLLLAIIQVLHLNAAQIGMRCGDKKAGSLTYSILGDNWYEIVLPPVEEEIRCRKEEIAHGRV
jgi:hypothetical protein